MWSETKSDSAKMRSTLVSSTPSLSARAGREDRVVPENFHFEAGEPFDQQLADVAEPEDADGLAGQLAAHEFALLPFAGAGGDIRRNEVAAGGEDHRDHLFGDGVGVRSGGVHHIDVALAGVLDVDGVEAGSGADDQLELRQLVDDLRGDLFTADDQHFRIAVGLDEIGEGSGAVEHHLVAALGEKLGGKFVEFSGNQNLAHDDISICLRTLAVVSVTIF